MRHMRRLHHALQSRFPPLDRLGFRVLFVIVFAHTFYIPAACLEKGSMYSMRGKQDVFKTKSCFPFMDWLRAYVLGRLREANMA